MSALVAGSLLLALTTGVAATEAAPQYIGLRGDRMITAVESGCGRQPATMPMQWVSGYLQIHQRYELPCVRHANADFISTVRARNTHSKWLSMGAYDDVTQTIYLPEAWRGDPLLDASILIHNLVYHLQNVSGAEYDCTWDRERLAYAAQEQWLRLHGTNLAESFQIDRAIFLLSSEYICVDGNP
jgi:hypothetical protein